MSLGEQDIKSLHSNHDTSLIWTNHVPSNLFKTLINRDPSQSWSSAVIKLQILKGHEEFQPSNTKNIWSKSIQVIPLVLEAHWNQA